MTLRALVPPQTPPAAADDERVAFVLNLGAALHRAGAPAHRLEDALGSASQRLGLDARFFSTPTSLIASFGEPTTSRTHMLRVEPCDVDLGLMADVDAIARDVTAGTIRLEEGARRLADIDRCRRTLPAPVTVLAYALTSAVAGVFLRGSAFDAAAAGLGGLVIGGLSLWPALSRVFLPLAALVAALTAWVAAAAGWGVHVEIVTIGGLIVLLPGLTLTVATMELASRHLVSGTARFAHAVMSLLLMGLGVAVGTRLGQALTAAPVDPAPALVAALPWLTWAVLPLSGVSLALLFRAHLRDAPWILVALAASLGGATLGATAFGPALGSFAGAMSVGLASNAFARLLQRPASTLQVPGIIMLVPGSIGLLSLNRLLADDVVAGVQTAFAMITVAGSLVAGVLVANLLLPPRRSL